ncbi:Reverse transcriptase precursor, partial [Phytophthora megakarya]
MSETLMLSIQMTTVSDWSRRTLMVSAVPMLKGMTGGGLFCAKILMAETAYSRHTGGDRGGYPKLCKPLGFSRGSDLRFSLILGSLERSIGRLILWRCKAELKKDGFLVLNVYDPHLKAPRETFFRYLASIDLPPTDMVMLGGDFNCTLNATLDRCNAGEGDHGSPALQELLDNWGLADSIDKFRQPRWTFSSLRKHYAETHTYRYRYRDVLASSRLDRWYTSRRLRGWISSQELVLSGAQAGHHGVRIFLQSPTDPIRVKKPARAHPPPQYAAKVVAERINGMLAAFAERISQSGVTAARMAMWWDELKAD